MTNKYVNKVIVGGRTLIDLTQDDVVPEKVAAGLIFHDMTGAKKTGTNTYTVDASSATATAAQILEGMTAGVGDIMVTGTMNNNGAVTLYLTDASGQVAIPIGFHDGTGFVAIDPTELQKLIPDNIKEGVTILGVEGGFSTDDISSEPGEATPSFADTTYVPTSAVYFSSFMVKAIPVTYTDNAAGGQLCTIGG